MKKILLITSEFPPLPGGIGTHAFFLSKYLQKKGYDLTVITDFRDIKKDIEFDDSQHFKIIRIKRNFFTYISRLLKAFSLTKNYENVILSGKFSLWIGATLKLFFKNKKMLAIMHGSELKAGGIFSRKLTEWSLKKMDRLIAVSAFTKSIGLKINPKLNIEVINNGIEITDYLLSDSLLLKRIDKLSLVTVGNLTYRKGQQNIIKALPFLKMKFPEIHYHCIGIPTEKDKFTKLAVSLNVLDNITFHGVLSELEKSIILNDCSIFCMLSSVLKNGDVEGFGIAVLEANNVGIPAVGSNDSGIADAINNHYSGILIDPNDELQLVEALEEILNNYANYAKNAREWSKKFHWDTIITQYEKALNS